MDDKIVFYNLPDFLDCVGEYWIDYESETLYVYEPFGDYSYTMNGTFMTFEENVNYINMIGLQFKGGYKENMINIMGDHFTFDGCRFGSFSSMYVIWADGVNNFRFENCEVYNFPGHGIGVKSNADRNNIVPAGNVIRNNYFHHHRARGMRIMALNGIIENNRIEQLEQQGISVGASYGLWTEAGWVENIIIRNNLVDTVCLGGAAFNQNSYSPGAICTFSHNDFGGGKHYSFPACNKGVVIENNRINNCALAGIHLISSYGAVVRNNVISNFDREDAPLFGKRFGIKYRKGAIGTDYSEKAVVENNKIISGGK